MMQKHLLEIKKKKEKKAYGSMLLVEGLEVGSDVPSFLC